MQLSNQPIMRQEFKGCKHLNMDIALVKKCLNYFEYSMVIVAKWVDLRISKTADVLEFSCITILKV